MKIWICWLRSKPKAYGNLRVRLSNKNRIVLLSIIVMVFMFTTAIMGLKWQVARTEIAGLRATNERLAALGKDVVTIQVNEIIDETEWYLADATSQIPKVPQFVTVQKGDWLSKYAKWYLGDATRWPEIWELNPGIKNPNLIHPGQIIRIW